MRRQVDVNMLCLVGKVQVAYACIHSILRGGIAHLIYKQLGLPYEVCKSLKYILQLEPCIKVTSSQVVFAALIELYIWSFP